MENQVGIDQKASSLLTGKSFNFTNEALEARCGDESPLAQRVRESLQLTFPLSWCLSSNPLMQSQETSFQLNVPPFHFLCVSLSVMPTPSYSLWFFLNNPMSTCYQLAACSASWPVVDFI